MRVGAAVLLCLAACGGLETPPATKSSAAPLGLVTSVLCDGQATVNGVGLTLEHARHEFNDGSVMATCSVQDSAREYGSTSLYRDTHPGVLDSECRLTYDVDGASGGLWTFRHGQSGESSTAEYVDAGGLHDGMALPLTCVRY